MHFWHCGVMVNVSIWQATLNYSTITKLQYQLHWITFQFCAKAKLMQSLTIILWSKVHSLHFAFYRLLVTNMTTMSSTNNNVFSNDSICVFTSVLKYLLEMNVLILQNDELFRYSSFAHEFLYLYAPLQVYWDCIYSTHSPFHTKGLKAL